MQTTIAEEKNTILWGKELTRKLNKNTWDVLEKLIEKINVIDIKMQIGGKWGKK